MRLLLCTIIALGLSISAEARQQIPGCNFHYYGSNQKINVGDGYMARVHPPEFQITHVYAQVPAQKRYERRAAYDGGPIETIAIETVPAAQSREQRTLIRPGYFEIKDSEGGFVGQFDKREDVAQYVCSVLMPNFGEKS